MKVWLEEGIKNNLGQICVYDDGLSLHREGFSRILQKSISKWAIRRTRKKLREVIPVVIR